MHWGTGFGVASDEATEGQAKETGGLVTQLKYWSTGLASGDPGVHPRHQGVVEHSFNPSIEEDQKFKLGIHENLSMIIGEFGGARL